jgi:hypothetical protein
MNPPSRRAGHGIHIVGGDQCGLVVSHPVQEIRANALRIIVLDEAFETLVPDGTDFHRLSCVRHDRTDRKGIYCTG